METAEQCVKSVKVNGKDTGTTSLTLFSVSMWYVCMCVFVCVRLCSFYVLYYSPLEGVGLGLIFNSEQMKMLKYLV